jgi:hypothetical protein
MEKFLGGFVFGTVVGFIAVLGILIYSDAKFNEPSKVCLEAHFKKVPLEECVFWEQLREKSQRK